MMKFSALLISAICFLAGFDTGILDEVRANYKKLVSDKALCEKFISELEKTKDNSARHLAYLGSLQTIWAHHVFSPISKLNTFNKGKKNIEQAIKKEPENVELRFVRLSVQKNAPSFLGYKSNVKEDAEFIRKSRHQVKTAVLQENIKAILND